MKRVFALILSLLMTLTLGACGGSSSSSQPDYQSVENETIVITVKEYTDSGEVDSFEVEGQYTGQLLNGVPEGEGTFVAQNDSGVTWEYSGEFKNGMFDGKGSSTWDGIDWMESGTYSEGLFTPNTFEMFNSISSTEAAPYKISEENQTFIESNPDLFPAENEDAKVTMSTFIQEDLTYPMMSKTLSGFEGKLYRCSSALVGQVFQESLFGRSITRIVARDQDYNYYYILYDGVLPDVYDGTSISFVGLPVSSSGFDNVGGGTTNVIVLIGCSVEVI